tara:strand:+ start:280 stop:1368 length:1089 start_codon:yes stop_codon:yes gene_type:complete
MAITKIPAAGFTGNNFRNIIINGDMSIAQRGTSTASITSSGYHTIDRWQTSIGSMGTWTQSQSTDVPTGQGFAKSLKMDCTTANGSPSSGNSLTLATNFEGQNLQYLKKGTSSAESTTLSFWVKSNKTGTYIAELMDNDNSNRHINKSYTISSADTWEKKTITFAGDTTGALGNDNGNSFTINFWLGGGSNYTSGTLQTSWGSLVQANRAVGQVNLADSTANEWYITGVQLEAGTTASDFEFLPVDINEQRCFRYFYMVGDEDEQGMGTAFYRSNNSVRFMIEPPFRMRTTPSLDQSTATNSFRVLTSGGGDDLLDDWTIMTSSTDRFIIVVNTADASGTGGQAGYAIINLADTHFALTAEL